MGSRGPCAAVRVAAAGGVIAFLHIQKRVANMKIIGECAENEYIIRCEGCNVIQTVKKDVVDRVVFCRQCHAEAETISQLERKLEKDQMQKDG